MNILSSYIDGFYHTRIKTRLSSDKVKAKERKNRYNEDFISLEKAHELIGDMLLSDQPMMVGRYGLTEAQVVGKYYMKQKHLVRHYGACGNWLYNTAGFFSQNGVRKEEDLDRFSLLMIEDSKQVDLIGASYALLEDYVINTACSNAKLTEFNNLRVMSANPSWGGYLRDQKVLVIHPFADTIAKQYAKREQIWKERADDILPDFHLITYKAIQTIAGNNVEKYADWFEALQIMKDDISKIDFDVAIVGCGAYGFPLAAACKRMGKKAIHLGGQVQMMFGISGKRWDDIPYYKQFINEAWVHPSDEEKPSNYKNVENGCYW